MHLQVGSYRGGLGGSGFRERRQNDRSRHTAKLEIITITPTVKALLALLHGIPCAAL